MLPEIAVNFSIRLETPAQPDVVRLISALDTHQTPLYPVESNYTTDISRLTYADVAFAVARTAYGEAIGCGGVLLTAAHGELKRMYVQPAWRGNGIGSAILRFLEQQARAHGLRRVYLETGIYQPEAIDLYRRAGYEACAAFSGYQPDPLSLFMLKAL
ncbi:GNAT family N-acetyltransferase [Amantichitinum ursilacus]|uniref:Putative N-acetyltransferase YsnE n=1 Tax=Amantichitinum ursilacus TaxID=857265 RepID=A0A0N0XFK7_9NEIS|nr:GNAT family N-acetyltransferase [Amantichitinum ursilacus]KPC49162.1 putative N-acetyltransferase YsnE [Amantichitinum ursilacus]